MCQLVYAFPRKLAELLSPSTFSPSISILVLSPSSSKRKSYHDFSKRYARLPFDISRHLQRASSVFSNEFRPNFVRFVARDDISPSISRNSGGEKMAKDRSLVLQPGFHEPSGHERVDKRREDEFECFFFRRTRTSQGRRWPDPERSTREEEQKGTSRTHSFRIART